jgi:hypothetical protein
MGMAQFWLCFDGWLFHSYCSSLQRFDIHVQILFLYNLVFFWSLGLGWLVQLAFGSGDSCSPAL